MQRLLVMCACAFIAFLLAGCGPRAPASGETTPEDEIVTTEIEDPGDGVGVEATTEETTEDVDMDEEMAPPAG